MKNNLIKLIAKMTVICLLLTPQFINAQFVTNFLTQGDVGATTSNISGIGIGYFNTTNIGAALHINTNLTAAQSGSGSFIADEVFRTQVPGTTATNWRAFRNNTQMFRFNIPASGNGVFFQSIQGDFNIASGDGSPIPAIQVKGGSGGDAGNVGIGDYSTLTSPLAQLHLYKSSTVDFQMSNSSSGNTVTDGLRIVMDNSGRSTFYNWEDDDIAFGTGNAGGGGSLNERLVISSGLNYGRVGIGTGPGAQLDVYDATDLSISGDDIGFQVDEWLQDANVANRGIGAEFNTKNGYQTIGISNTVDNYNTTYSSGLKLQGMYITIRDFTGASGTDYSDGVVIDSYDADNFAENKSGITATVGNATSTVTNSLNTYGANFIAQSYNGNNFGGKFEAIRPSGGTGSSYGVWGKAPVQTCASASCAGAAGYFEGEVFSTGQMYQSSDQNLKDNITPLTNASTILQQLTPKQYTFNKQIHPNLNLPSGLHYGFISQEVETVIPGIVKDFANPAVYDSLGNETYPAVPIKALNYIEIIPILVGAVNEQKVIIDSLILALQNPTPLPNINPQNSQKISLSNVSSIILNQNDPNPFTESTRITFQIPDEVKDARIIFTSTTGSIINTAIINERGIGELEVYSSELSKGLYNYTLVCDGKVIASKKMVKQ